MANEAQIAKRQASQDRQREANEQAFTKFNESLARAGDERAAAHLSKQGRSVITVNVGPHQRTFIDKVPADIARELSAVNTDQSGNQFNNFSIERVTQPGDFPGEVKRSARDFGRRSDANPRGAETVKDRLFRERKERDESRDKLTDSTVDETTPDFQNKNGLESVTGNNIAQTPERKSVAATSLVGPPATPAPLPSGFQQSGIGSGSGAFPTQTNVSIPKSAIPARNNIVGPIQLGAGSFIGPVRPPSPTTITVSQGGGSQPSKPLSPISQGLQSGFNFLDQAQVSTGPAQLAKEGITPQNKPVEFFGKSTLNAIIGAPTEVGKSVIATGIAIRNFGTQTVKPAITGKGPTESPITVKGTTVADATFPVTFQNGQLGTKTPQAIASDSQKFIQERGPSAFVSGIGFDFVLPGAQGANLVRQGLQKGAPIATKALSKTPTSGISFGDSVTTTVVKSSRTVPKQSNLKSSTSFARSKSFNPAPTLVGFGTRVTGKLPTGSKSNLGIGSRLSGSKSKVRRTTNLKGLQDKPSSFGKPAKFTSKPGDNKFNPVTIGSKSSEGIPKTSFSRTFTPEKSGKSGPSSGNIIVGKPGSQQILKTKPLQQAAKTKTVQKQQARPVKVDKRKRNQVFQEEQIFVRKQFVKSKTKSKGIAGIGSGVGLVSQTGQKQLSVAKTLQQFQSRPVLKTISQSKSKVGQLPGLATTTTQATKSPQLSRNMFATAPLTTPQQKGQLQQTFQSFAPVTPTSTGPTNIFTTFPPPPPPTTTGIIPPLLPFVPGGSGSVRSRKRAKGGRTGLKIHGVFNPLGGSFSIGEGTKGFRNLF